MALPSSGAITLAMIQAEFGGANPISLSEYYKGGAYVTASDIAPNVPTSGMISLASFHGAFKNVIGQIAYTTPGTYTWTVPASVSSVCVVCIGSCKGAWSVPAAGGSLSWGNNIPVAAGQQFTIKVGNGDSDISYFGSTGILYAGNGADRGGAYMGGGGAGGAQGPTAPGGGGGAGGYTGNGGIGGNLYNNGAAGSGGGGGGGGGRTPGGGGSALPPGRGGGTGILGQGANGAGQAPGIGGGGGSGGEDGGGWGGAGTGGGKYGGGSDWDATYGNTGTGAVRIIWGANRSFPSTNTGNL